jgi:hypothetical protein
MRRRFMGTHRSMTADNEACVQHVWVLAVIGEGRGRLDIASTCSLCGALKDESVPMTGGDVPPSW